VDEDQPGDTRLVDLHVVRRNCAPRVQSDARREDIQAATMQKNCATLLGKSNVNLDVPGKSVAGWIYGESDAIADRDGASGQLCERHRLAAEGRRIGVLCRRRRP